MPRSLSRDEIDALLALAVPARLATVDDRGYPHVTPLWFYWDGDSFWMTSLVGKPHLVRLRANPKTCVLVDVEDGERPDGQLPNRQVRAVGDAVLTDDEGGYWTRRITEKYVVGPAQAEHAALRASQARIAVRVTPEHLIAVASV